MPFSIFACIFMSSWESRVDIFPSDLCEVNFKHRLVVCLPKTAVANAQWVVCSWRFRRGKERGSDPIGFLPKTVMSVLCTEYCGPKPSSKTRAFSCFSCVSCILSSMVWTKYYGLDRPYLTPQVLRTFLSTFFVSRFSSFVFLSSHPTKSHQSVSTSLFVTIEFLTQSTSGNKNNPTSNIEQPLQTR